jgi:hypothetical protein
MGTFDWYVVTWLSACLLGASLLARHRHAFELCQRRYWRFLLQRWKLGTFVVSSAFMTLVGPYSNDPTWDYVDAIVMSVATFATAPWVAGTLYRFVIGPRWWMKLYIAICLWLLSASWFYDLYIRLRYGHYPEYWYENLFLSSILYFSGGLLWSLEWNKGRGILFQFTEAHWPERDAEVRLGKILLAAAPFMIVAAVVIVPFFR